MFGSVPFGMRPPTRFPIDSMMMGPFPLMMNNNNGGMLPPLRNLLRPMSFGMQPPPMNNNNQLLNAAVNNDLFEQRNSNFPLLPLVRSPFPQGERPQFRPFPGNSFNPQQPFMSRPIIQAVPQFRIPLSSSTPQAAPITSTTEKQFILPDLLDNSQEKSHVPEHRMNSPPETMVPPPRNPIFRMPERQSNPILPPFPEGLLGLLEDLPDIFPAEDDDDEDSSSEHSEELEQPKRISVPIFHVSSKPLLTIPPAPEASNKVGGAPDNTNLKPAVPFGVRPVTLPFLQVPPRSDAARQRALPMPINIPFMNLRNVQQPPPKPDGERRQDPPSFFERLIDSLLSVGNENNNNNKPVQTIESKPLTTPIRGGSRAMRLDEPSVILARPLEVGQEPISPPAAINDRPSDSHCKFCQFLHF